MSLLNRVTGYAVGLAVGLTLFLSVAAGILWHASEEVAAKTADWGKPMVCQVSYSPDQQPFGSPAKREVNVACSGVDLQAVFSQQDSLSKTVNVWLNSRTGEYYIARDLSVYVNDDDPPLESYWPLALLPLAILAAIVGTYSGAKYGEYRRMKLRRTGRLARTLTNA